MTLKVLDKLIFPQLQVEVVLFRIAEILRAEIANQVLIAEGYPPQDPPIDPEIWNADVVVDVQPRAGIDDLADQEKDGTSRPMIIVEYDDGPVERGAATTGDLGIDGVFRIVSLGAAKSGGKTIRAFEVASLKARRGAALAFGVMRADINRFLQFPPGDIAMNMVQRINQLDVPSTEQRPSDIGVAAYSFELQIGFKEQGLYLNQTTRLEIVGTSLVTEQQNYGADYVVPEG